MSDTTPLTRPQSSRALSAPSANLLWDRQSCVPLDRCLSKDDIILLLTPLVVPPESQVDKTSDPFEPLGASLSKRHPAVRHVPYTKQEGINGVHIAFIKKADVVIFVITGHSEDDDPAQTELADIVNEACDSRPLIVVACCDLDEQEIQQHDFPTIVQTTGFSEIDMHLVSSVLLDGPRESTAPPPLAPAPSPVPVPAPVSTPTPVPPLSPVPAPSTPQVPSSLRTIPVWSVQKWSSHDIPEMCALWNINVPDQFRLEENVFRSLIDRIDCTEHHVIRNQNNKLVGYCAAYITVSDYKGEQLIGSIAAMVVDAEHRSKGIGRLLHDTTLSSLSRVRGVCRIQLGSTFPRLLYGIPKAHPNLKWLDGKGWPFEANKVGAGRLMADWLLRFVNTPVLNLASAGLSFRSCGLLDAALVLDMAGRESERKSGFGWYDQYARILDHNNIEDVVLGFEGSTLVASAITYTPNGGNPTASDLPWAGLIGNDIGGITCICIKDDDPEVVNRRDTIKVRLLIACCTFLNTKGMGGAFADGLAADENGLEILGFEKWAEYHEVWKRI